MTRISPHINPVDDSPLKWIKDWEKETGLKWGEREKEQETAIEYPEEYEETQLEIEWDVENENEDKYDWGV